LAEFLIQSVISSRPLFPIATTTGRPLPGDLFLVPVVQDETGHLRDLLYRGKAAGNFLFGQGDSRGR